MTIAIVSRRKKRASVEESWPGSTIIDMNSRGSERWIRFSPFYPHADIPIPNSPGIFAQSVEGLWQGLKVFEHEDIDPGKWAITDLSGIKRGGKSGGAVRGHRFGIGSSALLGYRDARLQIYLPAYKWVLENKLRKQVEELWRLHAASPLVLLDYETNENVDDLSRPLSHAALIKFHLEGRWPASAVEE